MCLRNGKTYIILLSCMCFAKIFGYDKLVWVEPVFENHDPDDNTNGHFAPPILN